MSMLLLDADFNGNSNTLRLKYYDEGKPLVRIVDDYHPYLLEKGTEMEKFNPITLENEMYDKIIFETPDELNDYYEKEGGYEQMWYHRSYLSDKQLIPGAVYKNEKLVDAKLPKEYLDKFQDSSELFLEYSKLLFQPVPDFRMLSIDIKVEVAERPDNENPTNPIRLITAMDNEKKYCWAFDCNIDDAQRFDTETEMIEKFMEFIQGYPIILTFGGRQVVAQLVNAGQPLDEFRSGVRLDYVKVEKPVKVVVPEGLAIPKGQIKNSKVIPADLVKVKDVDTGALMKTFVSVFSQLLEPLKIEV